LKNKTYINSYCTIQQNKIVLNGATIFESEAVSFADFSKNAYQHFDIGYPKFFKMDLLSKLAFLGAELLLKEETEEENNIALLFANKSSSLDTDVKYQRSISDKENFFPSPAVFVYTLPNICLGEISIRHGLKSENSFFIFDAFNAAFMADYAAILIETHKAAKVLCGWADYFDEEYKAFLYLVSGEGKTVHNKKNLQILYNN
jgi:uncharacterized protein YqgQ